MILKAFVDAVMHLGLPGSGLCIVSCIAKSLEGEPSHVSRRKTDNTVTDLGPFYAEGRGSDLTMSAGLAFNRPAHLTIYFICLGNKRIYIIFKTWYNLCFIFHNVPFISQFYLFLFK